jgi:uncharacterized protein YqiB (DUF1249 family)
MFSGMENLIKSQKESISELAARIAAYQEEVEKLNELFTDTKEQLEGRTVALEETQVKLECVSGQLEVTQKVSVEDTCMNGGVQLHMYIRMWYVVWVLSKAALY